MKVFAANTTKQNQVLNFRVPEVNGVISIPVLAGRQTMVSDKFSMPQFEAMVSYMARYGMVTETEAKNGAKRRHPIVWVTSLDHPVDARLMARIIDGNHRAIAEVGEETRRQAALATSHNMREIAHTPNAAANFEMSIEEQGKGPEDQSDSLIGHGIHVVADESAPPGLEQQQSKRHGAGRKGARRAA